MSESPRRMKPKNARSPSALGREAERMAQAQPGYTGFSPQAPHRSAVRMFHTRARPPPLAANLAQNELNAESGRHRLHQYRSTTTVESTAAATSPDVIYQHSEGSYSYNGNAAVAATSPSAPPPTLARQSPPVASPRHHRQQPDEHHHHHHHHDQSSRHPWQSGGSGPHASSPHFSPVATTTTPRPHFIPVPPPAVVSNRAVLEGPQVAAATSSPPDAHDSRIRNDTASAAGATAPTTAAMMNEASPAADASGASFGRRLSKVPPPPPLHLPSGDGSDLPPVFIGGGATDGAVTASSPRRQQPNDVSVRGITQQQQGAAIAAAGLPSSMTRDYTNPASLGHVRRGDPIAEAAAAADTERRNREHRERRDRAVAAMSEGGRGFFDPFSVQPRVAHGKAAVPGPLQLPKPIFSTGPLKREELHAVNVVAALPSAGSMPPGPAGGGSLTARGPPAASDGGSSYNPGVALTARSLPRMEAAPFASITVAGPSAAAHSDAPSFVSHLYQPPPPPLRPPAGAPPLPPTGGGTHSTTAAAQVLHHVSHQGPLGSNAGYSSGPSYIGGAVSDGAHASGVRRVSRSVPRAVEVPTGGGVSPGASARRGGGEVVTADVDHVKGLIAHVGGQPKEPPSWHRRQYQRAAPRMPDWWWGG